MAEFIMELRVELADELPPDVRKNAVAGLSAAARSYLGKVDSGRPGTTRLVSANLRGLSVEERVEVSPAAALLSDALDQARQGYPVDVDDLADELQGGS